MIRAVIYARVSSAAQRDAHTIESQLHALRPFVKAQGWQLVGEYIDDGRSAKTGKLEARGAYARLLAEVASGRVDVVVTAAMDRLTRTEDLLELAAILGPLQRAGVRIVSPTGGEIDLKTNHGQMIALFQAQAAALENARRADRIKAGKARAIAEGRKPAGPTPYGHAYSRPTGTWSIDDAAAAIVREIFRRVAAGQSCVAIADDLIRRDVHPAPRTGWTRAAVYRIVRKRSVVGEWDADKAKGAVIRIPPIITEEEWQAASHALLAHKRRGLVRTKHTYLLEGIARCSCGARIYIRSATTTRRLGRVYHSPAAYFCSVRRTAGCPEKPVACDDLDGRVWAALVDEIEQPDLLRALADVEADRSAGQDVEAWQRDADGYRDRLAQLEKVEAALMVRFRRGAITETVLDGELDAIGRERKVLRDQLGAAVRAADATLTAQARLRAAVSTVERLRAALPIATPEQRRALLRELVHDRGVVISAGLARLRFRLIRLSAARSPGPGFLRVAADPGCRTEHDAALEIRRVA